MKTNGPTSLQSSMCLPQHSLPWLISFSLDTNLEYDMHGVQISYLIEHPEYIPATGAVAL